MRLQGKLILVFLFLSIVPLAISSVFMLVTLDEQVSRHIERLHTEELALLGDRMDWSLEQPTRTLRQSLESFDLESLSDPEVTGFLRLLYRQVPVVNALALVGPDGRLRGEVVHLTLAPAPGSGLVGHQAISAEEIAGMMSPDFIASTRGKEVSWGPAVAIKGVAFLHFPLAIRRMGPSGEQLLLALVSSTELADALGRFAQDKGRHVLLLDMDRKVLLQTSAEGVRMGRLEQSSDISTEIWSTMGSSGFDGSMLYLGPDRGERLITYSNLELVPLRLLAWSTSAEAFGPVLKIRREVLYWLGTSIFVAIIFAIFFTRTLTEPISALAQAVLQVARGNYQQHVEIQTADEIGDLASSFNYMAKQLQAQREEIDRQSAEISAWNVELQRRVEERTRELQEAQSYLVHTQKLAAVAELGSGVAHELNNPLAVVLGFVQILKEKHKAEGDPDGPLLVRVEEQAQRCRDIVQHLLNFSQAQLDQGSWNKLDLAEVFRSVVKMFEGYFSGRKVTLRDRLPPSLMVHGSRGQLLQATLQLVQAVRATVPRGAVLDLSATDDKEFTVVVLHGTLEGLTAGEPTDGLRLSSTEDRDQALSQGLGLWVAQKILQEHGGRIVIETAAGETSVKVSLPRDGSRQGGAA